MASSTRYPVKIVENLSAKVHYDMFMSAVQTTRMPMIFADPHQPDCPIFFANPAFLTMTGYDHDDLIGHNCRLLQGPETDREVVAQIRCAIEEQRDIAVEILNYKKNGSSFWNALFIAPVLGPDGELLYFFASQLDVTRRRDAEDALRQSQKMEAVGQLTGGIAHDFNNLLTVVQGFAEILQVHLDQAPLNIDRAKRAVGAILQATEKGVNLTAQLLAFARKQTLKGRVVSMRDLIDRLVPLIQQSIGNGIHIDIRHTHKQCNVRLDVSQIELALINIALNARDAMNGTGLLKIKTATCHITDRTTILGQSIRVITPCCGSPTPGVVWTKTRLRE